MPFCSNCGQQINDGAKFCPSCGTAVSNEKTNNIINELGVGYRMLAEDE